MIVTKEFLGKIKDFGLNSYEAKLWVALLSRGVSTAGELSDIANVPRSRTYDVLESLEKKGFTIMKLGKPIKYIAVKPDEVVERLKKHIQEDAVQKSTLLEEMKSSAILDELQLLHNQGVELVNPADLTGSFRGRDSVYSHMDTMIKTAEETITIMTTQDGLVRKIPHLGRSLEKAIRRGVKVRIAVPTSTKTVPDMPEGVEIRKTDNISARFMIVDSKEMTFMVLDDKEVHPSYDIGIWINSDFFAKALEQLFELSWKSLKPIKVKA